MEKRGGRGRASFHRAPREMSGLDAADMIPIVVVIMLLVAALGAFVANRSMRAAHPGHSWAGRLAESAISWIPRSEAAKALPTSLTAR